MEMQPKRARVAEAVSALQNLVHRGRISNDGLLELLTEVRRSNLDLDAVTQNTVRTAFLAHAEAMGRTVKMQRVDGGDFDWFFLDPVKLLTAKLDASDSLQLLLAESIRRYPPTADTPWRMVVGYDEFAPGNKLKPDNARKSFVLSFSFLELALLDSEAVWTTPVCVRHCRLSMLRNATAKVTLRRSGYPLSIDQTRRCWRLRIAADPVDVQDITCAPSPRRLGCIFEVVLEHVVLWRYGVLDSRCSYCCPRATGCDIRKAARVVDGRGRPQSVSGLAWPREPEAVYQTSKRFTKELRLSSQTTWLRRDRRRTPCRVPGLVNRGGMPMHADCTCSSTTARRWKADWECFSRPHHGNRFITRSMRCPL